MVWGIRRLGAFQSFEREVYGRRLFDSEITVSERVSVHCSSNGRYTGVSCEVNIADCPFLVLAHDCAVARLIPQSSPFRCKTFYIYPAFVERSSQRDSFFTPCWWKGHTTAEVHAAPIQTAKAWLRIPDGIRVRLREGYQEGVIDGLTELVVGPGRNQDGRTQYRLNLSDQARVLVAEDELLVLTDAEGLVLILKQKVEFRRFMTDRLRAAFAANRFVPSTLGSEADA